MRAARGLGGLVLVALVGLSVVPLALSKRKPGPTTVYDPANKVTWLADADLPASKTFGVRGIDKDGSMDYPIAVEWVQAMNRADYLGHHDWLLPVTPTPSHDPGCQSANHAFGYGCRKSAFGSLYSATLGLTAPATAVPVPVERAGPFTGFQPYLYWTATIASNHSQGYHAFSFASGWSGSNVTKHNMYVLPGLVGNPFGTSAPNHKGLHASADGRTVYDASTNVTWLANADLAKTKTFGVAGIDPDGSMSHDTAVAWIAAMNRAAWLGRRRWHLPPSGPCGGFGCTTDPLGALYYDGLGLRQGQPVVPTPDTHLHEFQDIRPYLYWSCAGSAVPAPCRGAPQPGFQWSFSFGNGYQGTDLTQNELYVTAYYPS
jgi:hypothetical protein